MNERDHERMCEDAAMGEECSLYLKSILDAHDCENIGQLARKLYKYTTCGASLAFCVDGRGWVYDAKDVGPKDCITALGVSSIVEGVDASTRLYVVDFTDDNIDPETYPTLYDQVVETVEDEAQDIWYETHGCDTCAEHFGKEGPVWDQCPKCGGEGMIL